MSQVNALLNQRLKKPEKSSKMAEMAKQTASGHLTSFSGIFSVSDLTEKEKHSIETILQQYTIDPTQISSDLASLTSLTSEVKAINNQAAILHGERIKKAQTILTRYKDGAFTAWLIAAYGNRQTPYNLLQYYEFYEQLPKPMRPLLETMPRQAIYTLASRSAPIEKKQEFISSFQGETKTELLLKIRTHFPLERKDKRGSNLGEATVKLVKKTCLQAKSFSKKLSKQQKQQIITLIQELQQHLEEG